MISPVRERALAKINLFLHVTGRRADGYHLLESLVVFADLGDALCAEPARGLSLSIDGPFGDQLSVDADNLVLRAAIALQDAAGVRDGAALKLTKSLPLASGIGGGSADAAAALRALNHLWQLNWANEKLTEVGANVGADVPICIASKCQMMRGIGEELAAGPVLPETHIVLANPLHGVETRSVFAARAAHSFTSPSLIPSRFTSVQDLAEWLAQCTKNDLSNPSRTLMPMIESVEAALDSLPDAKLTRMSGSGATCFALFETGQAAREGAEILRGKHQSWWVESGRIS